MGRRLLNPFPFLAPNADFSGERASPSSRCGFTDAQSRVWNKDLRPAFVDDWTACLFPSSISNTLKFSAPVQIRSGIIAKHKMQTTLISLDDQAVDA